MEKDRTVCFTGHRDIEKAETVEKQLPGIVDNLICKGYDCFLTGGARGFDALAAQTILDFRAVHPQIILRLVLPFPSPYEIEKGWTEDDIESYHTILGAADDVVYIGPQYKRGLYYKRDRYLVDNAAVCVAYQLRKTGGTAYTVNYAKEQGVKLIML